MTPVRLISLGGVLVLATACSLEKTFTEPPVPMAGIHFLNAVPDTMQLDFRVVDIPSNAGFFDANFRSGNMFYTPIEAGARDVRVFLSSSDPTISSHVMVDTTFTFTENANYTFILAGMSRAGQTPARATWVVPDNAAAPPVGQIGLRVIHAGSSMGNFDLRVTRHSADTLPDTPLVGNVAYGTVGSYVTIPFDSLATDTARIVVTAAGVKTNVFFTLKLPTGVAGTTINNPIAGARVPGSAMTAVVVPPSVVGSAAPQGGAFLTPTAVIFVDRRPPDTAP